MTAKTRVQICSNAQILGQEVQGLKTLAFNKKKKVRLGRYSSLKRETITNLVWNEVIFEVLLEQSNSCNQKKVQM